MEDLVDWLFLLLICLGVLLFGGAIAVASFDSLAEYRAFPKITACHAKRMDSMRRTFSADVTCVPYPTRNDSTTVTITPTPR